MTELFITVSENLKNTESFPIKIWTIFSPASVHFKVTGEDEKEDPMDFVLWKPKKEGEPVLGVPMVRRASGLAYRVLCNGQRVSWRARSISMQVERI